MGRKARKVKACVWVCWELRRAVGLSNDRRVERKQRGLDLDQWTNLTGDWREVAASGAYRIEDVVGGNWGGNGFNAYMHIMCWIWTKFKTL